MIHRGIPRSPLAAAALLIAVLPASAIAQEPPRPDFSGMWNSATATPLQRSRDLADKPFFTPDEAAAFEQRFFERNQEPPPGTPRRGIGTYNVFYREYGEHVTKTLRTSIITEPANGRLPALRPEAEARRRNARERQAALENPEELSLQDRCVAFSTTGPPMLPYSYNSYYQFIQTDDHIVIHSEMIHHARIIYMDGRDFPPPEITPYSGFSVGHFEGDTLVVETRNFHDTGGFYGGAGGHFGYDSNLRVIERFSFFDSETLLYRFRIENPETLTQPWAGELTFAKTNDRIYEYACHEGNYSLSGMLRGQRYVERNPG